MWTCNCGKSYKTSNSLRSHARFCKEYEKVKAPSSKYKIDEAYRCECGRIFEKYQSLNSHFSQCLVHRNGNPTIDRYGDSRKWNKGLTKETDSRIANYSKTLSEKLKGKPGHKHTIESRQKIANSARESNNGYIRTPWFEIFCPYLNVNIRVQGSWELKFAELLNRKNIPWERGKKYAIKYKNEETSIIHTYYPDFYLPTINSYVEIKGYWWKSKDGRIDDKRKMKFVIDQNPNKRILILDSLVKITNFEMPA